MRRIRAWLLILACWPLAAGVAAQPLTEAQTDLRYDLRIDVPVTVAAGTLWITTELLKSKLATESCRWCEPNSLDATVRDGLYWRKHGSAAGTASDLIGLGALPLFALGTSAWLGRERHAASPWWVDALIFTEAVALTADVNQAVKFSVARQRPFVHARSATERAAERGADDNMSFYSGHTSLAFSAVVAAGTLATLHRSRYARFIWAIGLPLAGLTGYLRIAADRHYLSDVLVGATLGSGLGALVPWLHRARPDLPSVSLGPTPTSVAVTWRR